MNLVINTLQINTFEKIVRQMCPHLGIDVNRLSMNVQVMIHLDKGVEK